MKVDKKLRDLEKNSCRLKRTLRQTQKFFIDNNEVEKYRNKTKEIKDDILSSKFISDDTVKTVIWNSEWDFETVQFLLKKDEFNILWLLGDMWGTTVWEFLLAQENIPAEFIESVQNADLNLVKAVQIEIPQLKRLINSIN